MWCCCPGPNRAKPAGPPQCRITFATLRCAVLCHVPCCALQLRPLLRELAALRRSEQGLQKQVDQLQLQLATADRDLQAAAAAAASDKALARRTITQAHSRLSAALQRLKALAERQQRQSLLLQEVSVSCPAVA